MSRTMNTRSPVEEVRYAESPHGAVIRFVLGKGQYATTFLSHLFTLVSGKPHTAFSEEPFDSKATLGEEGAAKTFQYFAPVASRRKDSEEEGS